ncbi:MAG: GHKL domain-containing protein [Peptococcaceae bacterium]|jgi:sensor histidine kinase YesM|nr:GHKL domain-containing protein [Peptococcaceae bacterium]
MANYDVVYLLSNLFGTYTIYKYMGIFFARRRSERTIELASYGVYFLLISTIYITLAIPTVTLVSNLLLFCLLTLNYSSTWKTRFMAVVCIYAILLSSEIVPFVFIHLLDLNTSLLSSDPEVQLMITHIASNIVAYTIMLLMSHFQMIKAAHSISPLQWLAIFLIPSGTVFTTIILVFETSSDHFGLILVSVCILFLINILVFYLYNSLAQSYQDRMERNLLKQQNDAYLKQMRIITQSQEQLKILQHDMKKHMATLQAMIEKDQRQDALRYLQQAFQLSPPLEAHVHSGHAEIDSILNYKISEAQTRNVTVETRLQIPEELSIPVFDLVAILGNLLDNAIEATAQTTGERIIRIRIDLDRSTLYLSVTNPFRGELKGGGQYRPTTRPDAEGHGYGLTIVRHAVAKYHGTMNITCANQIFQTDILLYDAAAAADNPA